jgi:hypothetical protein
MLALQAQTIIPILLAAFKSTIYKGQKYLVALTEIDVFKTANPHNKLETRKERLKKWTG